MKKSSCLTMKTQAESAFCICYLVLAHEKPKQVVKLIKRILAEDETAYVILHYDKSSNDDFISLKLSLKNSRCYIIEDRVSCSWGGFSLVKATLSCLKYSKELGIKTDYFYLLSGSCYPVRPLNELKAYLVANPNDYIECEDSSWIYDGIRDDRYLYYHIFNFRKNKSLFRWWYRFQKFIGLKRKLPRSLKEVRFGSQWWCLKGVTIDRVLTYLEENKAIEAFFNSVWIPDECFFQTVLYSMNGLFGIQNKTLTYYCFDQYGCPMTFSLECEFDADVFFCRKVLIERE